MSWTVFLQPASFNGVPFEIESTRKGFGRSLVVHDYPLRDDPYIEDLGGLPRVFNIRAYIWGDLYIAQRTLLETALQESDGPGTFVHPTYGILTVWVGACESSESRTVGGYATIDIQFSLDGGAASPIAITDTVSSLLASCNNMVPYLAAAYEVNVAAGLLDGAISTLVGSQLAAGDAQFSALPQATVGGVATGWAANAPNPAASCAAVQASFDVAVNNVVAAFPVTPIANDPVAGVVPASPSVADPSGGLIGMVSFGANAAPPPAAALPIVGIAQTAIISFIQGSALLAVLAVYGQFDWQSSDQAEAAAAALQPLLDVQVAAAADAGNFDLFRAWRAISAQAMADLTQRAQNLPSLAAYDVGGQIPALVLAQYLYQDSTQADALVTLNAAPHPLFMPPAGNWLQAA